jgi:MFS transporter, BCD family, chlorophyll transporter
VGVVWTFLLVGYTVAGILFSILLPSREKEGVLSADVPYSPQTLLTLFLVAGFIFGLVWFLAMWGEEKRQPAPATPAKPIGSILNEVGAMWGNIGKDLSLVWRNQAMRYFFFYLSLSMFFAFSQDLILEPFAGDVFDMPARVTNRFSAYWGTTAIIGTIFFIWYSRKNKKYTNTVLSQLGMGVLVATFALLALSSLANIRQLVTPGLILLGVGLGMWNVGTLGLMMDLSPLGKAGTFLGFWTLTVTFSRGFGTSFGGIGRDVMLGISNSLPVSYGVVFGIGAVGLLVGMVCLARVNVRRYKSETNPDTATLLATAMD